MDALDACIAGEEEELVACAHDRAIVADAFDDGVSGGEEFLDAVDGAEFAAFAYRFFAHSRHSTLVLFPCGVGGVV